MAGEIALRGSDCSGFSGDGVGLDFESEFGDRSPVTSPDGLDIAAASEEMSAEGTAAGFTAGTR